MKRISQLPGKTKVTAAVVTSGVLVAAGAAGAAAATSGPGSVGAGDAQLSVRAIASGTKLHHEYEANGASHTEKLTQPDDIALLGRHLFVGFQNGVGPQGEAASDGNLDSTVVEFTLSGAPVWQWDVKGKVDGLGADPLAGKVIATANEDANSSLYAISPWSRQAVHYSYNEQLPHKGGTDSVVAYHGQLYISASAPGTTGAAAPRPSYPAVYRVALDPFTKIAHVSPVFYDESSATALNGPHAGHAVQLGLTDPDSSEVVPFSWPRKYAGDFMLDSQGDEELIFDRPGPGGPHLSVLSLSNSVDDTAWATSAHGTLYATDNGGDTVNAVTGRFTPGTTFDAVTPCGANSAPATCPAPGYPADYLATLNLGTGQLTPVTLNGSSLHPQGMLFVP
ncbi:MAG TPA: hypothetical protein VF060_06835 [Trebonia sp.]